MFGKKKETNSDYRKRLFELESKKKRDLSLAEKKELKKLKEKAELDEIERMTFWDDMLDDE